MKHEKDKSDQIDRYRYYYIILYYKIRSNKINYSSFRLFASFFSTSDFDHKQTNDLINQSSLFLFTLFVLAIDNQRHLSGFICLHSLTQHGNKLYFFVDYKTSFTFYFMPMGFCCSARHDNYYLLSFIHWFTIQIVCSLSLWLMFRLYFYAKEQMMTIFFLLFEFRICLIYIKRNSSR